MDKLSNTHLLYKTRWNLIRYSYFLFIDIILKRNPEKSDYIKTCELDEGNDRCKTTDKYH